MRIALFVAASFAALVVLFILHTRFVQNPRVLAELEAEPVGECAGRVLVLSLPSGKSFPVDYWIDSGERGRLVVYVVSDFFWWRELRGAGTAVELILRGRRRMGQARAIENDPVLRDRVYRSLRPTAPRWFGVLVEIDVDSIESTTESPPA